MSKFMNSMRGILQRSFTLGLSILMAVLAGSIIMLIEKQNPIEVYRLLLEGAFGSTRGLFITIQRATPLIFTAIASTLAFRTGVFNVGVEGQFFKIGRASCRERV